VVVCPSAPGAIRSVPHNSSLSSDAGAGMVMRNACQVGTSRVKRDARRLRFCHLAASKGGSVLVFSSGMDPGAPRRQHLFAGYATDIASRVVSDGAASRILD